MTPQTIQPTASAPAVATPAYAGIDFCNESQLSNIQRASKMFASSALVPQQYQVKVGGDQAIANCVIALDVASRIGASPLMVMQNLYIVHGRPSWSAKFLIATVNTCGRFEPLKFRFRDLGKVGTINGQNYGDLKDIECVAYTKAKGSDEVLESSPITISLAIREGWYNKAGSKWQTMAKQMLMYRAASWWTSVYAPELSMGMRTVEENEDIEDVAFEEISSTIAHEVESKTASEPLDFDGETGEIYEPPTATPTTPPATEAKAEDKPKAKSEQVEAPF